MFEWIELLKWPVTVLLAVHWLCETYAGSWD